LPFSFLSCWPRAPMNARVASAFRKQLSCRGGRLSCGHAGHRRACDLRGAPVPAELCYDRLELLRPVAAGVARADGLQPVLGQPLPRLVVVGETADLLAHLTRALYPDVVLPRTKESFPVRPGGGEEG